MARQEIDLTTPQPNGKMGEPTKSAWEKVNDMTEELYQFDESSSNTLSSLKSAAFADIIGSVAQTGGVPTGAVMESGSNGNGFYFRFAGGLQICYRDVGGSNIAAGGIFNSPVIGFPVAFSATPITLITISSDFPFLINANCELGKTPTNVRYSIKNNHTSSLMVYHGFVSIGRWF